MINGVEESTESCTLLDVLRQKEIQQDRVVLELNETIVKLDLPAGNLDVIQRKRRGRPGLRRLGRLSR